MPMAASWFGVQWGPHTEYKVATRLMRTRLKASSPLIDTLHSEGTIEATYIIPDAI